MALFIYKGKQRTKSGTGNWEGDFHLKVNVEVKSPGKIKANNH